MFRFPQFILAAAIAAALLPVRAGALELGEISSHASLGQALNADIELRGLGDLASDDIRVSLAPQQDFDKLGLDRNYFLTGMSFGTEIGRNGRGVIRVKSAKPVREPYLDFVVQVVWPQGRVLREYTLLLDPPSYLGSQAAPGLIDSRVAAAPSSVANPSQAGAVARQSGSEQSRAHGQQRTAHVARKRQLDAARKRAPSAAPAVAAAGDNLHLVSGKAANRQQDAGATERLALVQEGLDSARRQGEELRSRIADLQSQVDKQNQLVTLKDEQMASLVARLAERNRQAGGVPAAKVEPVAMAAPATPVATTPQAAHE